MSKKRLLVIDDQLDICEFIRIAAEGEGFEVVATDDPETFKEVYGSFRPDIVVVDIVMPKLDGIELIKYLAEHDCGARVIIMSGYNALYLRNSRTLAENWGLPSVGILTKPIELDALEAALHGAEPGSVPAQPA